MSRWLDRTIAFGLLFIIALTALMFGTVEAWSIMVFKLGILFLVLLWSIKAVKDRAFRVQIPMTAYPVAGLLLLGLLQSIGIEGADGRIKSFSADPEATRATASVLVSLLLAVVLAANFLGSRRRLRVVAGFLCVYGAGLALFALIQYVTWNGSFYWFRPNTQSVSPFGPFANHNHYAGHMEMLALLPLGLLAANAIPRDRRIMYVFAAALMGLTIVTSLSRAGMISLTASILFLVLWGWTGVKKPAVDGETERRASLDDRRLPLRLRDGLKGIGAIVCVVIAIVLGIAWTGADPVINRVAGQSNAVDQESFYSSRGWIWADTISMIGANPIAGVGVGAYETAFPAYSKSDGSLLVNYAHNDYLQLLAEGGIIAGGLAVWFLVLLWRDVNSGARSHDPLVRGLSLGLGSGIFAILIHSLFDFNLQILANTLLFLMFVTLATGIAAKAKLPATQPAQKRAPSAMRAARSAGR